MGGVDKRGVRGGSVLTAADNILCAHTIYVNGQVRLEEAGSRIQAEKIEAASDDGGVQG